MTSEIKVTVQKQLALMFKIVMYRDLLPYNLKFISFTHILYTQKQAREKQIENSVF